MATTTSTTKFTPVGFDLAEHLGRGSVFEVALVKDPAGRVLVCKRSHQHEAGALERERDLLFRAREHGLPLPALVSAGSDARGPFLVETKASGTPVRASWSEGAKLDASTWLLLAQESTEALARLHAWTDDEGPMSFVHGDISPDNLFFGPPDSIVFIDLSSATWRDAPDPVFPHDRGTVPYAAPEILREEERASAASDTYALAATLLAAAVGPPLVHATNQAGSLYEAATVGILWKRIEERADLPEDARSAIAAALQYDRTKRLTSSRELAQLLSRVSPTVTNRRE